MNDLTEKEQRHVRTALLFLRRRTGGWVPLSEALGFKPDTLEKVANGRGRCATAGMAIRVARFVEVSVDELLAGEWLSPRTCPHCGHPPDDFVDEPTVVTEMVGGSQLTVIDGGKS